MNLPTKSEYDKQCVKLANKMKDALSKYRKAKAEYYYYKSFYKPEK